MGANPAYPGMVQGEVMTKKKVWVDIEEILGYMDQAFLIGRIQGFVIGIGAAIAGLVCARYFGG